MPKQTSPITPCLCCRNGLDAVEFYQKAFGAKADMVLKFSDGRLMHAALNINGAQIFLCEECPEYGGFSPQSLGGSPVTIHLQVADCDAMYQRAVDAGCEAQMPLQDMFWGDRYGVISDPFGHKWSIATTVREMTPDEMQEAGIAFCSSQA